MYVDSSGFGKLWLFVMKPQNGILTFSIMSYPRGRYLLVLVQRGSTFTDLRYSVRISDLRGGKETVDKYVSASTATGLAELFLDLWFERMPIEEVEDFSNFMGVIK